MTEPTNVQIAAGLTEIAAAAALPKGFIAIIRLAAQRLEAVINLEQADASGFSCALINGKRWWREGVMDMDAQEHQRLEAREEISEAEVKRAAKAMREADPVPLEIFTFDEICDLARAALKAAREG
jgi:hypothetical protein